MRPALLLLATASLTLGCRHEARARASPPTGHVPGERERAPEWSPAELDRIRRAVGRCPIPLTDAALDDLGTYQACSLPSAVARLVRNDYADDELQLPVLAELRRHAFELPRSTFQAQLSRIVDPRGVLAGSIEIDAARNVLRPDPVLAPDLEVPFAAEAAGPDDAACAGGDCAGRLVPPPHPDRPFHGARRRELLASARVAGADRPLAGLRVAIDPGHSGGPFAALEERRLTLASGDPPRPVVIQEGDLTLRTALELRAKLASRGAEVVLSRDRPDLVHGQPLHAFRDAAERLLGRIALDPGYAALESALAPAERLRLRSALAVHAVRKQSRFASLRARARLLSAAHPDLVLSIHYNGRGSAAGDPSPAHGASPGRPADPAPQELVAMIRGFHDRARLYNPYHRWRALEEAFAVEDLDASAHLAALCVRAMSDRLGIPVASENRYPDQLPVRDAAGRFTGVGAWDGALLRYLDGVAVLTEGPCMDDGDEAPRLEAAQASPPGTPGTRTERYADALAACVEEFARRWARSERNPFSTITPP